MNREKIVFVAYKDQENLGVGYLSAMLLSKGFDAEILDFRLNQDKISEQVKKSDPIIVGFSLSYQYHVFNLRELAKYLREDGVKCHFTVGGHYPSLRFEDVLNLIPEIDSVVRFEGEYTICELAENISKGVNWKQIKGIAYRRNGKPVTYELRPLINDLDILPFPIRSKENKFQSMDKNYSHIISSRGCVRNCAFCSIRKFYGTPPGRIRRSRTPINVVKEMKELYKKHESSIFLFQDDNFILPGENGRKWILNFITELEKEKLADKILFKINCRPDEINYDLFRKLKEVGLCLVYLGIESGYQKGLEVLNKQLSIEDNIRGVKILNRLKILYEFGFMLFDPYSTFESLRENIHFLNKICGGGSSPVVFGKTIPLAETDIEIRLLKEGRLTGSIVSPDYNFLDPRLDKYHEFMHGIFYDYMFTREGMLSKFRWHQFEVTILKKFYPFAKGIPEYEDFLKEIIASYNKIFFHISEKALTIYEDYRFSYESQLNELRRFYDEEHEKITSKLYNGMLEFQRQQQ